MSKNFSLIICALYGSLVLCFSLFFLFSPKEDFSPSENRTLSPFPSPSPQSIANGEFFEGFTAFCSDQFPLRKEFLSLNSSFELCLGKLESKNVMLGKNGNLIKRNTYNDLSVFNKNLDAIENIKKLAQNNKSKAVFFCAPRAVDVLRSFCHPLFDTEKSETALNQTQNADTVTDELCEMAKKGEYVFYKTDHHWTTLGAYAAYAKLGEHLGYTPYSLSEFNVEKVCDNFCGTTYSRVLLHRTSPDTITAYRYDGDEEIKVTDMSTGKTSGLYDYNALSTASKYDFFLGGNRAHTKIESGNPRLIIIKDSFANSLVPFLARHFDIDLIDPRYLRKPLESLISEIYKEAPDTPMLLLFGADTLCSSAGLER